MLWIQFVICVVIVVAASSRLSRYADVIAEKTGLGRAWVGAILLAGVTSLPELVSGVTAVNVLGGNLFNAWLGPALRGVFCFPIKRWNRAGVGVVYVMVEVRAGE